MKLTFHKTESAKINKLYLLVKFAGGDADTEHPIEYEYKGMSYDQVDRALARIETDIAKYKVLKDILDVNSSKFSDNHAEILKTYGKEIAEMYDHSPNDPQNDYQNKCYIDTVIVVGYDKKGDRFETYDLLTK